MKGKFLKVSSLFVATLTTATLVSSPAANALSSKAMDNHPHKRSQANSKHLRFKKAVTLNH